MIFCPISTINYSAILNSKELRNVCLLPDERKKNSSFTPTPSAVKSLIKLKGEGKNG
jgi:hypothetical protein